MTYFITVLVLWLLIGALSWIFAVTYDGSDYTVGDIPGTLLCSIGGFVVTLIFLLSIHSDKILIKGDKNERNE